MAKRWKAALIPREIQSTRRYLAPGWTRAGGAGAVNPDGKEGPVIVYVVPPLRGRFQNAPAASLIEKPAQTDRGLAKSLFRGGEGDPEEPLSPLPH